MRTKLGLSTFVAFVLLALAVAPALAQNGTLTGTITDAETGANVAGAAIEVVGGGGAVLSNESGQFRLSLEAGTYSISVSNLGYRPVRQDGIRVRAGATTTVSVALTSQAFALDGIVVTAARREQKRTDAPNTVFVVGESEVQDRPTATPVDHIRGAPGVDIITHGVQATNVVIRGFNNIFSGALHALTDNRLAGVPSLRVNLLHFIPSTNEDIERMEVVLGPAAALYGPNTANGVLHILTRSPLRDPKTTFVLGGGEQHMFQAGIRTSHLVGENFGFKISAQYISGEDFKFNDPRELTVRALALADPAAYRAELMARGLSAADAESALGRVGKRDFDFERFSGEVRADWAFDDGSLILQGGMTSASGIELTGLGAGQTDDWRYAYYQARFNKGRFFTQTYLNTSDAGGSYLLRDGAPLVDKSRLWVGQVQHGFATGDGRLDLTYGLDYFYTNPRTEGTINGINDADDNIKEFGAYAQTEIGLGDRLDLIVAGRYDTHSRLDDDVFSPRAALVFKPTEGQSLRFSFNRAFSTPTTLNLFLDISAGPFPDPALAALGYRLRAQGPNAGFSFQNAAGMLAGMRSPFNPGGANQLLPVSTPLLWQLAIGVLSSPGVAPPSLAPLLPLLAALSPTDAQIGIMLFDLNTLQQTPLAPGAIPDVGTLKESTSTTFEVGYQGVINDRVSIAADVWYSEREDFVSPLVLRTPLLQLNGPDIAAFLVPALIAGAGMDLATATATAGAVAGAIGVIPLATVSSEQVAADGADLLVTYVNAGTVDMYGADLALKWFVDDLWTIAASVSWVSDDYFAIEEVEDGIAPIALNAPEFKGSVTLGYRDVLNGFNAEGRVRFQSGFAAESAGFVGTECETGGEGGLLEEACVDRFGLVDFTMGYKVPNSQATLQLAVSNVFDIGYRSFVGVPEIGRMAIVRVKYDIF